ncbi:hypothetical protein TSOC_007344 [Tetrabaena socialis]|uniref:Uncharacterized protein n=1 Tax=Tetrabaena socialis TaxID=47790 RepID=A0A2J8A1D9_9CHLO|nr:hypothetical protein TSOC_007344 [Tetrabaena socialis]|eukprot:PNH06341.1 hypothetical protein TSOC_007344 [Tetrabaena socialis]
MYAPQAAASSMVAALSGGASWGMADAEVDAADLDDPDSIDWRALVASGHKLNDKQQKLAEKIRAREWKLSNLTTENQRISAKEKQEGGLTQGQATTLARNEQCQEVTRGIAGAAASGKDVPRSGLAHSADIMCAMEKLSEEVEDLDEEMRESIRDALLNKKRASEAAAAGGGGARKRRGRADSDDDGGSDSDDEFFDRTAGGAAAAAAKGAAAKRLRGGVGATVGGKVVTSVESAEGLYGKRWVAGCGKRVPGRARGGGGGGGGAAEAAVAADLEVLAAARRRREELAEAEAAEAAEWKPPVGQRGDGRTTLHDKLGY